MINDGSLLAFAAFPRYEVLSTELPLLERAGQATHAKADWLLDPRLAAGGTDDAGTPAATYEPEGNSTEQVSWLHRT